MQCSYCNILQQYPGNPDIYGGIFTAENTLYKEKRRRANRGYKDRLFIRIFEKKEDCLAQGYLAELLTDYRREVIGMLLYEYDEKKHLKNTYEEGVKKGVRRGISQGERRRCIRTARNLYCKGYSHQEAADILEEDEKTVATWFKKWSKM